jgi:hypothetical protein
VSQDEADQAGGVAEFGVPRSCAGVSYPGFDLAFGPGCAAYRLWDREEPHRVRRPRTVRVVLDLEFDGLLGCGEFVAEPEPRCPFRALSQTIQS